MSKQRSMCIQHVVCMPGHIFEVSVLPQLLLLRAHITLLITEYHGFFRPLVVLQVCSVQQLQESRHLVGQGQCHTYHVPALSAMWSF